MARNTCIATNRMEIKEFGFLSLELGNRLIRAEVVTSTVFVLVVVKAVFDNGIVLFVLRLVLVRLTASKAQQHLQSPLTASEVRRKIPKYYIRIS